jgi:hypothetical protein
MKWILLCCTFLNFSCVQASVPSKAAVLSCLSGHSTSTQILLRELPTNEILSQDNYSSGYNATYYFKSNGKDIGYAERSGNYGLIFSGVIYPLGSAKPLLQTTRQPIAFTPYLADWSIVTEAHSKYLCVSFNFDGLGRSGSYQKVRGGYLLSTGLSRMRRLYFAMADVGN